MKKTYSEKLKDPRWQKLRLKIMERDNFTCQLCDDKRKTLNIHHKQYVFGKEIWQYSDEELITLCEDCHSELNKKTKLIQTIITNYIFQTKSFKILILIDLATFLKNEEEMQSVIRFINTYTKL